jgi:phosphoribosylanthranilate isomerase
MTATRDFPFIIKVCGITNLEDARAAVEAGANALGFNFYTKSPRYIPPARARQIASMLPASILKTGVFVNPSPEGLVNIAAEVNLDVLQLHGNSPVPELPTRYRVWKAMLATESAPSRNERIEAYLIDAPTPNYGGSGKIFDWTLATGFPYRAIIAGGLDGSNVAEAIRTALPQGVDACSRLEASPGRKDAQRVCDFVHAALAASRLIQELTL